MRNNQERERKGRAKEPTPPPPQVRGGGALPVQLLHFDPPGRSYGADAESWGSGDRGGAG